MKLPIKEILQQNPKIKAYIKGVFVDKDGKQEEYETFVTEDSEERNEPRR